MKIDLVMQEDCTRCSACYDICLRKAIEMVKDRDGFFYPMIDYDICIYCGKCYSACPVNSAFSRDLLEIPEIYASCVKDYGSLMQSASGGAFSVISDWFMSAGSGFIYGVAYDKEEYGSICGKHICSNGTERIQDIKGSKYVFSNMKMYIMTFMKNLNPEKEYCLAGRHAKCVLYLTIQKHKNWIFISC